MKTIFILLLTIFTLQVAQASESETVLSQFISDQCRQYTDSEFKDCAKYYYLKSSEFLSEKESLASSGDLIKVGGTFTADQEKIFVACEDKHIGDKVDEISGDKLKKIWTSCFMKATGVLIVF